MSRFREDAVNLVPRAIVLTMAAVFAVGQAPAAVHRFRLAEAGPLSDTTKVQDWVTRALHAELRLDQAESLTVASPPTKIGHWSAYAIARSINGVPAVHQDLRLLLDPLRRPVALLGHLVRWAPDPLSLPALNDGSPKRGSAIPKWPGSDSRLVYWPQEGSLRLSYEIAAATTDSDSGERLMVEARTGSVLARIPSFHSALERKVYDFQSACRSAAIRRPMSAFRAHLLLGRTLAWHLLRTEGSRPSGNAQVDGVFDLLKHYHRFLEEVLGLDSYDDQGGSLKSIANVRFHAATPDIPQCVGNEFSAAWVEPARIALLPVGIARFPEVVGHEFGHAVISSGSGLLYSNQPGALNESIADGIGVAFRAWLVTGGRFETGLPPDIWKMRGSTGVVRDMQNPRRVGNLPNHYSDYRHLGNRDNGGVHVNSSILNQGFYLLAAGGRHPDFPTGPNVSGIGLTKAVNIFGRAGFNMLPPNADFRDAREAFALVAEILYGPDSAEWVATHTAMDAIGIPGGWDVPAPPSRTVPASTPDDPQNPLPRNRTDQTTEQPAPTPTTDSNQPAPTIPEVPREGVSRLRVLISLVVILCLLCAGLLANARRQARKTARVAGTSNESDSGRIETSMGPMPAADLLWNLAPLDGTETVPLSQSVLESSEGLVIGRASELCHVRIQDPIVSRRHVRCRRVRGTLWIEDLNSTAGTRVGHTRARPFVPVQMFTGDVMDIGGHKFSLISLGP